MSNVLQGRNAVVTGAGQGLGRAIVERLLMEGCRVIGADIQEPILNKLVADFGPNYGADRIFTSTCDVTNEADVARVVDEAVRRFGGIDIFVANAGILISGSLVDFDVARWRKVIDVNMVGQMLCMKHAFRIMGPARRGSFIQINSKSGKKGSFKNSAYAASKFGAIGLVQSAALEMADMGVRVNAICPGNLLDSPLWKESLFKQYAANQGITEEQVRQKYIDQVPMRRPCTYDDVCNVLVFLASDQASYMTGQAVNVTGGQEMR